MRKIFLFLLPAFLLLVGVEAWAATSTLTFNAACGGSGTANDGAVWTVTSDAAESTYDGTRGIHYGTGNKAVKYLTLTTDDIDGTITRVVVNASGSNSPTLSVSVGGNEFDEPAESLTTSNAAYTFDGSASGAIVVDLRKSSSATGALYIKSVVVTYSTETGEKTKITIDDTGITNTNKFVSTSAGSLTAVVKDESDDDIDAAVVTWSSSNTSVATINSSGSVTLEGAGSTTITASYAGESGVYKSSSNTYNLIVTNEDPDLVTIWNENFSSYSANDVPSGGINSYVCNGSGTKIYSNAIAGGASPELLVAKGGGYFEATIPLNNNYAGTATLKFKANASGKSMNVTSGTTGVAVSGGSISTDGNHEVSFTNVTAEMESLNIKITNSEEAGGANIRIDDIILKIKEAPTAPTFDVSEGVFEEAFDLHLSAEDGAAIYYTTNGTTPTSSSSLYDTKIAISTATTTVKAIAVKNGLSSAVASATYTYDARTTPSFTISPTLVNLKVNVGGSATLTTNHDGTITATSSNSTDLPVSYNNSTKVCTFTPNKAGEYTITLNAVGSATYKDASGVITVNVTKKTTSMSLETAFASFDIAEGDEGLIEGTVKYNSDALDPQPAISYSSSDENVATVNSDGEVAFLKAGTTTLTASYAGDDEYDECEATYELTIINTTPQAMSISVTTNYLWLGVENGANLLAAECPKDIDCSGVTATIDGNGTYPRGDDTYIRLYAKSTLKLSAPTNYIITNVDFDHKTGSNTVTASVGTWNGTTHKWTGSASNVTFTIGGTSGNNQINGFTITLARKVTVGEAGWASLYFNFKVVVPEGVTAYYASEVTSSSVKLTEIGGNKVIPENFGVVINASEGDHNFAGSTESPAVNPAEIENHFDGVIVSTPVANINPGTGNSLYVLGNEGGQVGFYLPSNSLVNLAPYKAYLIAPSQPAGAPAIQFIFEGATDINNIEVVDEAVKFIQDGKLYIKKNGIVYDLLGTVVR